MAMSTLLFLASAQAGAVESPDPLRAGEHDVELNGVRIHYSVHGTGPVLIAHSGGPGMDARIWGDCGGLGDVVTVVTLHPRGSGLSGDAPAGEYRLEHYVADLLALREHLGADKPIVIGWSHGGIVAQVYASQHPEALSKLILLSTSANLKDFLGDIDAAVQVYRDEPWFDDSYAALQDEWAGNYQTEAELNDIVLRELKFYFAKYDERAAAYLAASSHLVPVRTAPLKVFNDEEVPTMDLRESLAAIRVPTLVIAGRHDFVTNAAMAEDIAAHIDGARLEVFEHSGHFSFVEERQRFHDVVAAFVQEGTPSDAPAAATDSGSLE